MKLLAPITRALGSWLGRGDGPSAGRIAQQMLRVRQIEAANTSRINESLWTNADGRDLDSILLAVLPKLRNRARYEGVLNNGDAKGLIKTVRDDTFGKSGPRLQIESDSDEFNEAVERAWEEWCEVCDFRGRLHLIDILKLEFDQLWWAGEWFTQEVYSPRGFGPVKLRLATIAADRIDSPYEFAYDQDVRMGVRRDADGRIVGYYVSKGRPNSSYGPVGLNDFDFVPARDLRHWFRMEDVDQTRGMPWLTPTLEIFAHLRKYDFDVQTAARIAAQLSGFIHSDHQGIQPEQGDDELPIFDVEPGTMTTLPAGWKVSQLKPEQPAATYESFRKIKQRQVGRSENVPYVKSAADASGHNYSSARFDGQGYWNGIEAHQGVTERFSLTPRFRKFYGELRLATTLPKPPKHFRPLWTWPAQPDVDEAKAADAQTTRLSNKTTTFADECRRGGRDWREVFRQQKREREYAARLGIDLTIAAKATPGPKAEQEEKGEAAA